MSDLSPEELIKLVDNLEANRILDAQPLSESVRRIRSVTANNFARLPSFYVQAVEDLNAAVDRYAQVLSSTLDELKQQEADYGVHTHRSSDATEPD